MLDLHEGILLEFVEAQRRTCERRVRMRSPSEGEFRRQHACRPLTKLARRAANKARYWRDKKLRVTCVWCLGACECGQIERILRARET
jgi:hypothetical protein